MDGGVSFAAIEIVVQNLIFFCKEKLVQTRGLEKNAQQLQDTLVMIQGYLSDAEKKSITQEYAGYVEIWLKLLKVVAVFADNDLDELSYHLLQVMGNKSPMDRGNVLSSCNDIGRPRNTTRRVKKMARRIKTLNEWFETMKTWATILGFQIIAVNSSAAAALNASFETNSFTLDPIFIGRDDDVQKLVANLTDIPDERIFSILAIVGRDGIGKTTLARKVFNHENLKAQFGSHIWVHVSEIFEPVMLFKKILSKLTSETTTYGGETKESILKKLQQVLKGKAYLLVLDDVQDKDLPNWEDFINSISGVTSTKGNAIIVTAQNQEVASTVGSGHIHLLKCLSHEECFSIINAKIFGNGDGLIPSEFDVIGRMIAETCQGLPLAANIVGGMLRGRDWLSIVQKWFLAVERYDMLDFLKFIFRNFSSPSLEKCFAYCSIFPKGHKIVKQGMIELWMAEGFFQHDEGNDLDLESVGNSLFNVLLKNSFLQVAERDAYGNVESCVMHYLVHDLASAVLGSSNDTNHVRYLFHGKDDSSPIAAKYLRTLIFQGEITNTTTPFSDFKYLHVLTLDCDQVRELPSSVRKLIHLRYLNISRTQIEYLPDWIYELCYLQTLNAFTESLRELPSTFKHLISLRHLYIQSGVELPPEIGRLMSLQELKFRVGERKGYKIEELGGLNNLKQLYIQNLEKVRKLEAKKANLIKKSLITLQLEWGENGEGERINELLKKEEQRNHESVLEGLEPGPTLERLKIMGFKGKRFPSWTEKMAVGDPTRPLGFDKLIEITLVRCQGCVEIPMLGQLPNLKSLSLRRLSNVRFINRSFYGNTDGAGVIFPALESILLSEMAELSKWEEEFSNEVKVFPRLQSLKMYHCYKLECLPSWLFSKARDLKELDIRHCPKLTELPDGLYSLNSLEKMTMKCCQTLKSIVKPTDSGRLTSLRSLEIRDCKELKEIVERLSDLLKKVSIVELKSLENLPSFLHCLAKSPYLEQLTIVAVPKFCSSVEIWPFKRLQKLEIDVSRGWSGEASVAILNTVNGILQKCCSSLGELVLTGLEMWKDLPESIQQLEALYSIELENFGVEKLPQWFGNLSSLTRLCLSDFTNLRELPSMQGLTNLQEFHILDCQELRIESERYKIAQNTFIYINGHQL